MLEWEKEQDIVNEPQEEYVTNFNTNWFLNLFEPLNIELKKEILYKLSKSINNNQRKDKNALIDELFGSWEDTNNNLVSTIYNSRISSDKNINFD